MKIVKDFPPNYEEIISVLKGVQHEKNVIFTYGDTLYNPNTGDVDTDLLKHEETHAHQQEQYGIKEWWSRYLIDDDFRITQETEAYYNQYISYCSHERDRNKRTVYLYTLARDLSSDIYGGILSVSEAKSLIQSYKTNVK